MNDVKRPERAEVERQERRRRDDSNIDGGQKLKLAVPIEVMRRLEKENRTPRWVNDIGNRMDQLTVHDDYDRVDGVEPVEVIIDAKTGQTAKSYLLAKRNDFIAADRAKREVKRSEVERAMTDKDAVQGQGQYLVEGSEIKRQRGSG